MTSPLPFSPSKRSGLRLFRRPSATIRPASPRPQRRDCQSRLIAALIAAGGERCTLVDASFRPWCSATFIGAQHRIILRLAAQEPIAAADALMTVLPDADLPLPGHIVVDVVVDRIRQEEEGAALLDLTVLTVEDW